jgi:hypothetical protein
MGDSRACGATRYLPDLIPVSPQIHCEKGPPEAALCVRGRSNEDRLLIRLTAQGVYLLIRVDQLPSAPRLPGPWLAPAQVPSRLSPLPPAKNGPAQSV